VKNKYLSLAIAAVMFMVLPMIAQAEKLGFDSLNLSAHGHSADCLHAWSPPDLLMPNVSGGAGAGALEIGGEAIALSSKPIDGGLLNKTTEECSLCKPASLDTSVSYEVGWRSKSTAS